MSTREREERIQRRQRTNCKQERTKSCVRTCLCEICQRKETKNKENVRKRKIQSQNNVYKEGSEERRQDGESYSSLASRCRSNAIACRRAFVFCPHICAGSPSIQLAYRRYDTKFLAVIIRRASHIITGLTCVYK